MADTKPMTVGALKALLANTPDDRTVWVYDFAEGSHQPVTGVSDDKRSKSINLWVN